MPPRQPIHVVYAGAPRFSAEVSSKLGAIALRALDEHAPSPFDLAALLGESRPRDPAAEARAIHRHARDPEGLRAVDPAAATLIEVHDRVRAKLEREPVEDFRVDFEDGYGPHTSDEEDADAVRAGSELARGIAQRSLPPFVGIRVRPLEGESAVRALRTLELVVREVHARAGALPERFVVTLPKVESEHTLRRAARALGALESELALAPGSIGLEAMVETPSALVDEAGTCPLPRWVVAGEGRLRGVHLGAYDLTASVEVPAPHQSLHHPVCVEALVRAQLALAGRGVHVADGATTQLPLGGRDAVHAGWRVHAAHVREAIALGVWQGWDLHPAQIVARLAALHGFFLGALADATARMANFRAQAERATRIGASFDDAATGRGLRGFFARGLACGALDERDLARAGLAR